MNRRLALCAPALALFVACKDATSPRPPLEFSQLSAGSYATCGVATDSKAYCWGLVSMGVAASRTSPTAVAGDLSFLSVTVGWDHVCGITSGGIAYCWGANTSGQLGLGFADSLPHPVPERVATSLTFATLTAGSLYTCGVTTSGEAWCWGDDLSGGLGSTATTGESCRRTGYSGYIQAPCSTTPVPVAGGLEFASVSAGVGHTCGVTTGGGTYCWGDDRYGELGAGPAVERCAGTEDSVPCSTVPAPVAGALQFAAVSAGGLHTCAVTTGGEAWCWGENEYAQLGTSATFEQCYWMPCSTVPVAAGAGVSFASLSAGLEHTCGVTTAGVAYCWGDGVEGKLGDAWSYLGAPGPVSGGLIFRSVTAGVSHTCGITTSGAAYCWGDNVFGQLGIGKTSSSESTPQPVVGAS